MNLICNVFIALHILCVTSVVAMEKNHTAEFTALYFDPLRPMHIDTRKGSTEYEVKLPVIREVSQASTSGLIMGSRTILGKHSEHTYLPYSKVTAFIGHREEEEIKKECKLAIKDARNNDLTFFFTKTDDFGSYQKSVATLPKTWNVSFDLQMRHAINKIVAAFEKKILEKKDTIISQYSLDVLTLQELKDHVLYKETIAPIISESNATPILVVKFFTKEGIDIFHRSEGTSYALVIPLTEMLRIYSENFKVLQSVDTQIFTAYSSGFSERPLYMQVHTKNETVDSNRFDAKEWDEALKKFVPEEEYTYDSSRNIALSDNGSVLIPVKLDSKQENLQLAYHVAMGLTNGYIKTQNGTLVNVNFGRSASEMSSTTHKISQKVTHLLTAQAITQTVHSICAKLFEDKNMLFSVELKQLYELKIALENCTDEKNYTAMFYKKTIEMLSEPRQPAHKDLVPLLIVDVQTLTDMQTSAYDKEPIYQHTLLAIPLEAIYDRLKAIYDISSPGKKKDQKTKKLITIPQGSYVSTDGFVEKQIIATSNDNMFVTSVNSKPCGSKKSEWCNELSKMLDEYEQHHYKTNMSENRFKSTYFIALANDPYYNPFSQKIKYHAYSVKKDFNNGEPSLDIYNQELDSWKIQENGDVVDVPGFSSSFKATVWQHIQDPGMTIQEKKAELLKNKRFFTPRKMLGLAAIGFAGILALYYPKIFSKLGAPFGWLFKNMGLRFAK